MQRINNNGSVYSGAVPKYDIKSAGINREPGYLNNIALSETAASGELSGQQTVKRKDSAEELRNKKFNGELECKTCSERQYVDGSDDPGVSFKTPAKISPKEAPSLVMSHEREHASRESAKAKAENKQVVSNTISLHTAICPECGKSYVAGGTTVTVVKSSPELDKELNSKVNMDIDIPFDDYMPDFTA